MEGEEWGGSDEFVRLPHSHFTHTDPSNLSANQPTTWKSFVVVVVATNICNTSGLLPVITVLTWVVARTLQLLFIGLN